MDSKDAALENRSPSTTASKTAKHTKGDRLRMTADFALDPQDSAPLYAQLYRDLRQRILDGAYAEGEAIPSETVLRDLHGITRSTVRHAVSLLVSEGLVRQSPGQGNDRHLHAHQPQHLELRRLHGLLAGTEPNGPSRRSCPRKSRMGPTGPQLRLVRARGVATDQSPTFLNLDTSVLRPGPVSRSGGVQLRTVCLSIKCCASTTAWPQSVQNSACLWRCPRT